MSSSKRSLSGVNNKYVVLKLYRIPPIKQRKSFMNTCEELIKQVLAKVK